jgi:hypothetical protein
MGLEDMKPTYEQLVQALEDMIEAYQYSGGGDIWEREVWGERTKEAEKILEAASKRKRNL